MVKSRDLEDRDDIVHALDKVSSDRTRLAGLVELKRIVHDNRQTSELKQVNDRGYHAILEPVFKAAKADISAYSRAPKSTKTKLGDRLSACASLVRTLVEVGLSKLRYRTVKALLDHITQSLQTADGDYCDPLVLDYFRALATLLGYEAHLEHLSSDDWTELSEFCIVVANDLNKSSNGSNSPSRSFGSHASRSATPSNATGKHASQRTAYPQLQRSNEDICLCLQRLFLVPSAPLLDKAEDVLSTLLELLQSHPHLSKIQQAIFETINSILSRIITCNIVLSLRTLTALIPLIRVCWELPKPSQSLKDSLLSILIHAEILLPHILLRDETEDCKLNIIALVDVLREQYCNRTSRTQLILDDIDLSGRSLDRQRRPPLSLSSISIRLGALKAEEPWSLLHASAALLVALEKGAKHKDDIDSSDDHGNPRKRQKLSRPLDDIVSYTKSSETSEKLYALQVLAFCFDCHQYEASILETHLELLITGVSDDDGLVASWTMLVLTSVTFQSDAVSPKMKGLWLQIWRLVARTIISVHTSRPACHLMAILLENDLVRYTDVADLVEAIVKSPELNGPAQCDEAATRLLTVLLALRRQGNLSSESETSRLIIHWLFKCWSPSNIHDRHHVTHLAQHVSAFGIVELALTCLGMPPLVKKADALCLGRLAQVRLGIIRNRDLIRYLLLDSDASSRSSVSGSSKYMSTSEAKPAEPLYQRIASKLIELLVVEGSSLLECYFPTTGNADTSINVETVSLLSVFCIVGYTLLHCPNLQHREDQKHLHKILDNLRGGVQGLLLRHEKRKDLINGFYESFGAVLGPLGSLMPGQDIITDGVVLMSKAFNTAFWQDTRSAPQGANGHSTEQDAMDLDFDQGSQSRDRLGVNSASDSVHHDVAACSEPDAFRACVSSKICFMSELEDPHEPGPLFELPNTTRFVDYLTSLGRQDFIYCKNTLRELLSSEVTISEDDADTLLQYIQQAIIRPYDLERSEVSIGVCLDTLADLAQLWTGNPNSDVAAVGAELYLWLMNNILRDSIPSSHVYMRAASFFQKIIKVCPDYARSLSIASARTSLFAVLRKGDLVVKYHIGNNIADVFGLFVLKEHDSILDDVIANLPKDSLCAEGIALRLYVLACLGASWSTLLRRCVYAIFEAPGQIPSSSKYAQHCLVRISRSIGLSEGRDIFKLFVPQILYTWIATEEPLRKIPFTIFSYASLGELVCDVQDEVVGQIVMRGRQDEAVQLSEDVNLPYVQLLENSFSKAAAYSIARDVAIPPSASTQAPQAEARLRKSLGKEKYSGLVSEHFAEILSIFYTSMDFEEQIERSFQQYPAYAKVFQDMISYGVSDKVLPPNQQPSFKAKYLLSEIEHLCHRTSYDVESIWSPSLYVYVFRRILETSHPALGPLHACSVLRKIRILICMAGATALENYSLEMALHSLKSFLTDIQCAEDATAIARYLIERGNSYLQEVPSFVVGNAVSTLTAMKTFFGSTQDSTTQESYFTATMNKAQAFHTWFVSFLEQYSSKELTEESATCFNSIVKAASNVRKGGSARVGTYEAELLLELLEDQRSGRNLLSQSSKDSILRFLCTSFELPSNSQNDILGDDDGAAQYAATVWETCQRGITGKDYLLWSGRVLGRAYAGKGHIDGDMVLEVGPDPNSEITPISAKNSNSRTHILRLLMDLLVSDERDEVGLAEMTLRGIVTGTYGTEYSADCDEVLPSCLRKSMLWKEYQLPRSKIQVLGQSVGSIDLMEMAAADGQTTTAWIQQICRALAFAATDDPMLSELPPIIKAISDLSGKLFPFVLHLVLLKEVDGNREVRQIMSQTCRQMFLRCKEDKHYIELARPLIRTIVYLRTQPMPHESSKADRSQWLDLDYHQVAVAANQCSLYKTSLLFLEMDLSEQAKASRRSSVKREESKESLTGILLNIYQNIDEQDAFYGVQQPSSLASLMTRLEHEHAGFKSLSFRSAHFDGQIRQSSVALSCDDESMVRVLDSLDLNGLSQSLLRRINNAGSSSVDAALRTARRLEQWDISAPVTHMTSATSVFRAYQKINNAPDTISLALALNTAIGDSMNQLLNGNFATSEMRSILGGLAALTETEELFSSREVGQLSEIMRRFRSREEWMLSGRFEHVSEIISCRETAFSSLSRGSNLQAIVKTSEREARSLESQILLASSRMSRVHGALQSALKTATYLTQLVEPCAKVGVDITTAVQYESANVLWAQGEMTASIGMLQDLRNMPASKSQLVDVGKAELLAKLGHQISEARQEKPDEIIQAYLLPAIKELHGHCEGKEAGQVFHEFAFFCDQQLQNQDSLEDFQRIKQLRERKEIEVKGLEKMMKSANTQTKEKANYKQHRDKAKLWFDLDDREYQRLQDSRHTFLRQSLENYLLCLKASDQHDGDATRFSALWLENFDNDKANAAVAKHIHQVGSRKFVPLINQWSSRLQDTPGLFQSLLSSLVMRICSDHPFHGMYHMFASSKSKGGKDEVALARHAAANKIVDQLKNDKRTSVTWLSIHNTNINFVRFAQERLDDPSYKSGSKFALKKSPTGQVMEQTVVRNRIPPPTMTIELRPDCDYSKIPIIASFLPQFAIASGISMPKIVTAVGTDGQNYKQLFKGGSDDLRQDAIMEQVFSAVSSLLKSQRPTRQRDLKIRTYKVLPLTNNAGIIEFVPDTIPLSEYLTPAHQRHFPSDLKPNTCRKHIADAQSSGVENRTKVYRKVCDHFHPVMRFFFMERFENPDDWFERRLAYTRSTAAISILGHILGLGDRHMHNILLDEKTGEVVHIDLGIAFEQGRVLPVPELVPFRLTRDLVDGMGITGTEGVFRRCCEFTLEALRNESYSIMTILDVLRYDPLYSWSLSPLRVKKMQDAQAENPDMPRDGDEGKKQENEAGEADRALLVVRKKLSKTLSVQAMVNELITAATDPKNLAVLFCGWAAYA